MTLLTVNGCEPCKEVKKIIADKGIDVDVVEIKKYNGKYVYENFEFPEYAGFPILYFGVDPNNGKPNYLMGKEGIISYLTKGFVYSPEGKICPYSRKPCIETKCAKFGVFFKGMVPEGGCSDYWTPILITELISKTGKN